VLQARSHAWVSAAAAYSQMRPDGDGPDLPASAFCIPCSRIPAGFLSVLLALLEAPRRPSHLGVVLDAGGSAWGAKNFRWVPPTHPACAKPVAWAWCWT
jgi:hypothetical protein